MRLTELPTHSLRDLAGRCEGLNAVLGDRRLVLKAVATACYDEVTRRVEGGEFRVFDKEMAKVYAKQIKLALPKDFERLIWELE